MLTFNVTPEGQSLLNNATAGSSPLIIDGVSFYHNDRRIKTIKFTLKGCSFNDGNGIGEYVRIGVEDHTTDTYNVDQIGLYSDLVLVAQSERFVFSKTNKPLYIELYCLFQGASKCSFQNIMVNIPYATDYRDGLIRLAQEEDEHHKDFTVYSATVIDDRLEYLESLLTDGLVSWKKIGDSYITGTLQLDHIELMDSVSNPSITSLIQIDGKDSNIPRININGHIVGEVVSSTPTIIQGSVVGSNKVVNETYISLLYSNVIGSSDKHKLVSSNAVQNYVSFCLNTIDSKYVHITGNENINGNKTFNGVVYSDHFKGGYDIGSTSYSFGTAGSLTYETNIVNNTADNAHIPTSLAVKNYVTTAISEIPAVDLTPYLTKVDAQNIYQVKGNYALVSQLPTKTSDLNNDVGYITSSNIPTEISYFNNDEGYLTQHQPIKTVNNNNLIGTGNVDISTGEYNVIESISVNNVTQTVINKNVNITVPTDLDYVTLSTSQTITSSKIFSIFNTSTTINSEGITVSNDNPLFTSNTGTVITPSFIKIGSEYSSIENSLGRSSGNSSFLTFSVSSHTTDAFSYLDLSSSDLSYYICDDVSNQNIKFTCNDSSISVSVPITPLSDSEIDLGSSSYKWNSIYAKSLGTSLSSIDTIYPKSLLLPFGICSTRSDDNRKVVSLSNNTKELTDGMLILVLFTEGNSATSVGITIDNSVETPVYRTIKYNYNNLVGKGNSLSWAPNEIVLLLYTHSSWIIVGHNTVNLENVTTNIVPSSSGSYNLGSAAKIWNAVIAQYIGFYVPSGTSNYIGNSQRSYLNGLLESLYGTSRGSLYFFKLIIKNNSSSSITVPRGTELTDTSYFDTTRLSISSYEEKVDETSCSSGVSTFTGTYITLLKFTVPANESAAVVYVPCLRSL